MMVPKISAQLFGLSLLTGTFALISIGNAIASEIPTVQVSAVDRQSELLEDSTDDSIAKIGGIYPINTLLNPESAPATSNLALARRKKRINTKPQIKREGVNTQPQIQNTPVNTTPQIQNTPINIPSQVQNTPINTPPQVQNPQINTTPPQPSGLSATQNQIQYRRNDLGVAVQFGNGTSVGFQGKIGVMDNISIRPEFFFGSGGGELENKEFTSSLRIPAVTPVSELPNPGTGGYSAFSGLNFERYGILTEPFTVNILRFSTSFITDVAFGNFAAGTLVPAGTDLPAGTVLPAGFVLPRRTSIFADGLVNPPPLNYVIASYIGRGDQRPVLANDYKVTVPFTTIPNQPVGNIPGNTPVPAGTIIPAGTPIPFGVPFDSRTDSTIPIVTRSGAIKSKITKSTSLGLAVTYDFKLDPQGKSTAYLGPKVAFTSTVGEVDVQPGITNPLTLNANETKIGLVAGIDYVLFDGFTIGANANYYFSRSLSGSVNSPTGTIPFQSAGGGSSTDFGLRIGYQF
jgi:hypothetical protein